MIGRRDIDMSAAQGNTVGGMLCRHFSSPLQDLRQHAETIGRYMQNDADRGWNSCRQHRNDLLEYLNPPAEAPITMTPDPAMSPPGHVRDTWTKKGPPPLVGSIRQLGHAPDLEAVANSDRRKQ